MGDRGVALVHAIKLGIGEPDAMTKHSAAPDEAVVIVDVEEILPLWKAAGDKRDLVAILGDVGL